MLDEYVKIESLDDVVIAYTPDSREPAAWVNLALSQRGFSPRMVYMSPLHDPGFCERLRSVIPGRRTARGRCILMLFELDTMSHSNVIKAAFSKYEFDQYKVVRAINSGRDLFATGMAVTPVELSALNTSILERCRSARSLLVETEAGTSLKIELDNSKYRWISNRGIGSPGNFLILPAGEVATFPAAISGTLVADFALHVNLFLKGDSRLSSHPVTVEIEESEIKSYHCKNRKIKEFLDKYFKRPNARKVGELGFGTNKSVKIPVPENSHLNERCPGVHIGFGQHNQTDEAAGYSCKFHLDLIARGGTVRVDDSPETIDLEILTPSANSHPELINGEDVFSPNEDADDCCGVL